MTAQADRLRSSLTKAIGLIGGTAVLFGGIRLLANYGQAMSTVQAVAQATTEQFTQLSDQAQRLGITTRFSAAQAAEGMVFLARSGLKVDEVLGAIESTLRLAQAGALDLGSASKITAETMRAFRLEVTDAERIVDVFALTANSANTDVAQLGQGMKFVGAVATGLNVSLETTTAAMAALSDAGLQATMAGTGLRRVLAELESPSNKTQKMLEEVGLTTDDIQVSTVGLIEALKRLKTAGIDTGDALEIFGQRGGPAFEVLSNSIPKIEAMEFMLMRAEGTAKRVADVMDKNLKGALLALRSAWEGLILNMGDAGTEASALTHIVRGLTAALRTLADNAEILNAVFVGLLSLGFLALTRRIIPFLIGKLVALATTTKTVSVITAGSLAATSKEITVLSAKAALLNLGKLLINPMFVLATATTGAYLALQKLNGVLDEINESSKIVEKGVLTEFGKIGDSIIKTQERISRLQSDIAKNADSPISVKELEKAKARLAELREEQAKFVKGFNEQVEAQNRSNKAFKDINRSLAQEALLLKASNAEREVQKRLFSAVNKLQEEGLSLSEDEIGTLEDKIRTNQALNDQADILDRLRGPQEDYARGTKALQALLQDGRITLEEYRAELNKLSDAFSAAPEDPFQDAVDSLENQIKVLQTTASEGEAAASALETELALMERGVLLTPAQRDQLRVLQERVATLRKEAEVASDLAEVDPFKRQTASLRDANAQLNTLIESGEQASALLAAVQSLSEKGVELSPGQQEELAGLIARNEQLKLQAQLLGEIVGPADEYAQKVIALNALLDSGAISLAEYNAKMEELELTALQADTSLSAGLARGLSQVKEEVQDVGGLLENTLVNAFGSAEDALVSFVRNGTLNFRDFVNSVLDDIARLLVRLLLLQSVQAITGGAGGLGSLIGGALGGGKAEGGPVQPNKPVIVGERGPELFNPSGAGRIVPANETAAALAAGGSQGAQQAVIVPAPEVKVDVNNFSDPSEVPAAMDSPAGDKVILNALQRNKNQTRRILS